MCSNGQRANGLSGLWERAQFANGGFGEQGIQTSNPFFLIRILCSARLISCRTSTAPTKRHAVLHPVPLQPRHGRQAGSRGPRMQHGQTRYRPIPIRPTSRLNRKFAGNSHVGATAQGRFETAARRLDLCRSPSTVYVIFRCPSVRLQGRNVRPILVHFDSQMRVRLA